MKVVLHTILGSLAAASALASSPHANHVRRSSYDDQYGKHNGIHLPPPSFTYDELYSLQEKFLDNFLYPHNKAQVRCPPFIPLSPFI